MTVLAPRGSFETCTVEPSHVMRAMDIPRTAAHGTIRFSLSRYNTQAEKDRLIEAVPSIIAELRKLSPFWGENGPVAEPEKAFAPVCAQIGRTVSGRGLQPHAGDHTCRRLKPVPIGHFRYPLNTPAR